MVQKKNRGSVRDERRGFGVRKRFEGSMEFSDIEKLHVARK